MRWTPLLATVAMLTAALPAGGLLPGVGAPANDIDNGGFEDGLEAWNGPASWRASTLTDGGCQGTDQAAELVSRNDLPDGRPGVNYLWQHLESPLPHHAALVAGVCAKMAPDQASDGWQAIALLQNWPAGPAEDQGPPGTLFVLRFFADRMQVGAAPHGAFWMDTPDDGDWHRYEVVVHPTTGHGVFLLDDEVQHTWTDDQLHEPTPGPMDLLLGDLGSPDPPTVHYDEIVVQAVT